MFQQQKSNQNAKIGFIISYPFQFLVVKNVYKKLEDISEIVVDMGVFYPEKQPDDLLLEIISILESNRVFYRVLNYEDYYYSKYLEEFFSNYSMLVSLWEWGSIKLECNFNKKKVCLTYGAGKEINSVRPSRGYYDLILSYGKRDHELFSYYTKSVIIGNPVFDDWFNDNLDVNLIKDIKSRINQNKKTILYLPTHSDLSSIDIFFEELVKIKDSYNIIVKPHYLTLREEPEKIKLLEKNNLIIYRDNSGLLPLLKISDMVISDNSSAIFDAILADKPILVADFWDEDFLDNSHRERKQYKRGNAGAVTFSGSIEQLIKKDGSVTTINNAKDLYKKILETLNDDVTFKEKRSELRDKLFSYNDGRCSERGAEAILKLLNDDIPLARPILYHAIEIFKENLNILSFSRERKLKEEIQFFKNALYQKIGKEEIFFSVLFINDKQKKEDSSSLRSILEQNFPAQKFEIILIGQNTCPSNIILSKNLKITSNPDSSIGEQIMEAVLISKGSIICLTTSDVITPNDWLLSMNATYQKNKKIIGCGGYMWLQNNPYLNNFYTQEVSNKIGLGNIPDLFSVTNNIFSVNPVGILSNTSYKKEVFENTKLVNMTSDGIELSLKIEALNRGDLTFIPKSVTMREKMTLGEFLKKNKSKGLADYVLNRKINFQKQLSILDILIYTLIQLSREISFRNLLFTAVVASGYLYRYLGKVYGFFYIHLYIIKIRIEDTLKANS